MQYNKERHIELLKRSQDFKNQGKGPFLQNQEEDFELSQYNIAVHRHLFWQDRYQVALLMQDFLKKKIDSESFCDDVYGLRCKLLTTYDKFILELISNSEKLKGFQPDERANKLKGFLTALYCECECFVDTDDYQNDAFYQSIKTGFLKFQKILNSDFAELTDQLNWENREHYIELIEAFLAGSSNFLEIKKKYQSILKAAKELDSISTSCKLSYQALGFSNYLLILIQLFDRYLMDNNFSSSLFKSWVRKILFEIKNHYS